MGLFFSLFLNFLLSALAVLFSALAYSNRNTVFFYLGLIATAILTLSVLGNFEYTWYYLQSGDLLTIVIAISWLLSIVFLSLSKGKRTSSGHNETDSFLDDVINSEDEWDGEI